MEQYCEQFGTEYNKDASIDFKASSQFQMEEFMQSEEVEFDEDYTVNIGADVYRIRTEGWFPDCMESRDMGETTTDSIMSSFKNIMEIESDVKSDITGYMPNYRGTEFGVTYIGVKL